jgi:hypothetical protein
MEILMKSLRTFAACLVLALASWPGEGNARDGVSTTNDSDDIVANERQPQQSSEVFAAGRGQAQAPPDPLLLKIAKNGSVLKTPTTLTAVFWGPEWNDPTFGGGDTKSGLSRLLTNYSGTSYAGVLKEYNDKTGSITGTTGPFFAIQDNATPPVPGGLTGAVARAKACEVTGNNPDPNGVYFIFTSTPKDPNADGFSCMFRTWGTCSNGKPVQVVAVPYTDGVTNGCVGVSDDGTATGHSPGLAQMANLAIGGLTWTIADPKGIGWEDSFGDSVSMKCRGTFPASPDDYPTWLGEKWKLSGLWSNKAYLAGTGAPNADGKKGCVWK